MRVISFKAAKKMTARIMDLVGYAQVPMVKLPIDNVIFDKLGQVPLLEMMVDLCIVTKESVVTREKTGQELGHRYPKRTSQMVFRIIDGRLLLRGKDLVERPDAYAWPIEKVLGAKNKRPLGFHSTAGALNYAAMLQTIKDPHEQELFTDLLVNWSRDLIVIHTDAEERMVIRVTEEMLKKHGIIHIPNSYDIEWPAEGAPGVELTPINLGDALVVEECSFGPAVYVVQKDEFELTYRPV